jgi:hypothetical protein
LLAAACGGGGATGAGVTQPASFETATWHPAKVDTSRARRVKVDAATSMRAATSAIAASECVDAVLVWGDYVLPGPAPEVVVELPGATIAGHLQCERAVESFLRAQRDNPRMGGGHGGSADLRWRDGAFFLKRAWAPAEAPLGLLAPYPDDVLQPHEALAAIVTCDDPAAPAAKVLGALAHVPERFVFGMLPRR